MFLWPSLAKHLHPKSCQHRLGTRLTPASMLMFCCQKGYRKTDCPLEGQRLGGGARWPLKPPRPLPAPPLSLLPRPCPDLLIHKLIVKRVKPGELNKVSSTQRPQEVSQRGTREQAGMGWEPETKDLGEGNRAQRDQQATMTADMQKGRKMTNSQNAPLQNRSSTQTEMKHHFLLNVQKCLHSKET